ncbi:hypothetical protein BH20ACT18_BH20ACT18_09180 [soil metagenome]
MVKGETRSRAFLRQPGVSTRGAEQGMPSMAFAPDYATSGRFYVVFTDAARICNSSSTAARQPRRTSPIL